jgi:hypothetical protein
VNPDHELAARLATRAGELLVAVRTELAGATEAERKAARHKRSHDFLVEALAAERPDDTVLSEEGAVPNWPTRCWPSPAVRHLMPVPGGERATQPRRAGEFDVPRP